MGRRGGVIKRKRTDSTPMAPTAKETHTTTTSTIPITEALNASDNGGQEAHLSEVASSKETAAVQETATMGNTAAVGEPAAVGMASSANPGKKRQKREEYRAKQQVEEGVEMPRKRFYRQRAHANPFSDHLLDYPICPSQMDWSSHFPDYVTSSGDNPGHLVKDIEVADVGCGFGGLLFALAPKMPESLILGLEIRVSVTEFVVNKIRALRHQATLPPTAPSNSTSSPHHHTPVSSGSPGITYQNISCHRTNTMKFLPNFFPPASLSALFLCFPDPHFKARKHKARIVSATLCAEYFYAIKPGGRVYTITDVEDLAAWMAGHFDAHPGFRRVKEVEWRGAARSAGDAIEGAAVVEEGNGQVAPVVEGEWGATHDWKARLMLDETEEGKKVTRNGGKKFVGIWERLETPAWPGDEDK